MKPNKYILHNNIILLLVIFLVGCKKFIEVDPPRTDLIRPTVFTSDATATAAISAIYNQMVVSGFSSGDVSSFTFVGGLSSDELNTFMTGGTGQARKEFYDNALLSTNAVIATNIWGEPYKYIYKSNAIIEGLAISEGLTPGLKSQLEGEAKFIRAFSHFYLVNLFGDIPLVTTTNYITNASIPRTPKDQVYQKIIADLKEAQSLLSDTYSFSNDERVRPNKWAATALLVRVYLYAGNFADTEIQATAIINNNSLYSLANNLNSVFLKNSTEAIWQLMSASASVNTREAGTFIFATNPTTTTLRTELVNSFEAGDLRKMHWTGSNIVGMNTYYYAYKYKIPGGSNPLQEYSMVLRLAEQYLIRAEARSQLGNIGGALADINIIRARAGLPNFTGPFSQSQLLSAIEQERRVELFTEWGHRWLDLKRTNRANGILAPIKPAWQLTDVLYPIPQIQLQNDPAMANAQNPGY